jgi:phage gp29-like protein
MSAVQLLAPAGNEVAAASRNSRSDLLREQAVRGFEQYLWSYSGLDETLRRLGIARSELSKLLDDDEVFQATDVRRDEVTSTPWTFEPSDHPQLEWYQEQFAHRMDDMLETAWNAVMYGVNVQEVIYENPVGGRWPIKQIIEKPFDWFVVDPGRNLWYKSRLSGNIEATLSAKYVLTLRRPSYVNPMGEGILSRLYWAWFFRCNGWQFWMSLLERFGLPFLIGTTKSGIDPVTKKSYATLLQEELEKARQGSSIAVSEGTSVNALDTRAGSNNSNFRDFEAVVTSRIQKVVLGQSMTSELRGQGSSAAARAGHWTIETKRASDVELLRRSVQRFINTYHVLNRFPGLPPDFIMQDPQGLETDRADRDGKLHKMGVRFNKKYFSIRYLLDEGEFELTSAPSEDPEVEDPSVDDEDPEVDENEEASEEELAAVKLSAEGQFGPVQQSLEDLVAETQTLAGAPLTTAQLKNAVLKATDSDDLTRRLSALLDSRSPKFTVVLARAMNAAQILGYVNQQEKRT